MSGWASRGWLLGLASLALVGAPGSGACGGPGAQRLESPEQPSVGTPIGRSNHPRSGRFSYRLGTLERQAEGIRVDLRLSNGTKRDYSSVVIRVTVHGKSGEMASVRIPLGPVGSDGSRPVSARIPDVAFSVRDVTVELIYAVP